MHLERIENKTLIPSYTGRCPVCDEKNLTYIHDIRCVICDNASVIWCPSCKQHFEVKEDVY